MALHCRTCGDHGNLSLLDPEHASLLPQLVAGCSVCHDCVVQMKLWSNFLHRFQTSQTHFQQVLKSNQHFYDSNPKQTVVESSLEKILPKCCVLVTKLLECDSCSFYTDSNSQLATHKQAHLHTPSTSVSDGSGRHAAIDYIKKSKNHNCTQCGTKSVHPEMLAWHTEFCHGANAIVKVLNISNRKNKFQCVFCKTKYADQYLIILHLHGKHKISNLPFRCNTCVKQYVRSASLKRHQIRCKNRVGRVISFNQKCEECGVKYHCPETLAWHIEFCHGTAAIVKVVKIIGKQYSYQCLFCLTVCKNTRLILRHLCVHHGLVKLPFHCIMCDGQFLSTCDLKYHEYNCKTISGLAEHKVTSMDHFGNTSRKSGVECKMCNTVCKTEIEMKIHISNFHAKKKANHISIFVGKKKANHISNFLAKKKAVHISNFLAKKKAIHISNCHAEKRNNISVKCDHCDQSFPSYRQLDLHSHNMHPGKHFLKCDVCKVEFVSYEGYMLHTRYKHSSLKLFNCKICSVSFSWPNSLRRHIKTQH